MRWQARLLGCREHDRCGGFSCRVIDGRDGWSFMSEHVVQMDFEIWVGRVWGVNG